MRMHTTSHIWRARLSAKHDFVRDVREARVCSVVLVALQGPTVLSAIALSVTGSALLFTVPVCTLVQVGAGFKQVLECSFTR